MTALLLSLAFAATPLSQDDQAAYLIASKGLEQWQLGEARGVAENLVAKAPDNADVLDLASRVQFHRGEYESAASLYAAALEAGVDQDSDYARVVTATERLTRGYLERESAHFRVKYPAGKDDIFVDQALPVLEAAYERIARDLGLVADASDKTAVLVVPDAEGLATVSTLLPQEIENSGTIAICKFNRLMVTSPLATYHGYQWADTLAHEYAHLVINLITRNRVPIWLHEGLAKFVETRWDGEAGRWLSAASINLLARAAKEDKFIPFERMHPSMAKLPTQEEAGLAFAEVFVAIKMLQEKRGIVTLRELLAKIGAGSEVEAAVASVYGKSFREFLSDWRERLKTFKGKVLVGAKIAKIELKKAKKLEPTENSELGELEPIKEKKVADLARLGELLHLRGRTKAAAQEYEKAYTLSGPRYPSLLNKYAMALVQNGDDARAAAVLNELLLPHPDYAPAHLALGRIQLKAGKTDEARQHFRAALLTNPFNPEIYASLLKIDGKGPEQEALQKHLAQALGRDLPAPAQLPVGEGRLTVIYSPFGRMRLPSGLEVAYPAVGVPVPRDVADVELIARDGRTAVVHPSLKGDRLVASGKL